MHDIEGIHNENVTAWFEQNITGLTTPLSFELIAGGHSNLTFAVTDAAGKIYVLRRPPLGHVLESAHDMGREHKIISALAGSTVPVAATIGLCTDVTVNEAPFYVMEYVSGPLFIRYFILQFALGALLPIAIMTIMIAREVKGRALVAGISICALLVLMNVLMMRWNVVIGGQEISKTTRGLLTYPMLIWGRESLITATAVTLAPLGLLYVLTKLFPPWHEPVKKAE